jgi:hypothetical protein
VQYTLRTILKTAVGSSGVGHVNLVLVVTDENVHSAYLQTFAWISLVHNLEGLMLSDAV